MLPSKTSQLFQKIDQTEYLLCLRANRFGKLPSVHSFFSVISRLGDGVFWYVLIFLLPIMFGSEGMPVAILMVVTGVTCTLIYKGLKQTLVRERPFISFPLIEAMTPPLDRYSFPSGHTLHAVCFCVLLCYFYPWLGILTVPFTILVMISRVVLGLHYPSDVSVGALIGALLATISIYIADITAIQQTLELWIWPSSNTL